MVMSDGLALPTVLASPNGTTKLKPDCEPDLTTIVNLACGVLNVVSSTPSKNHETILIELTSMYSG